MAAAMGADDLIVACDVRDRRVDLLRRTIAASGASNVRIVQADLLRPLPFPAVFDCVLVDAPCSGLGTLRRDPDIRWRRRESDLAVLADAQRLMLQHAAAAVAEGGRLVYATCSSEPEENEAIAEAFVRGAPGFEAVDARLAAPRLPAAVVDARGHLRTLPARARTRSVLRRGLQASVAGFHDDRRGTRRTRTEGWLCVFSGFCDQESICRPEIVVRSFAHASENPRLGREQDRDARRRPRRDVRLVCRRVDASGAEGPRGRGSRPDEPDSQRSVRDRSRPRAHAEGRRCASPGPEDRRRARGGAGSGQRGDGAASAKPQGLAERWPARQHDSVTRWRNRADGAAATHAGRPGTGECVGDPVARLSDGRRARAGASGQERGRPGVAARQPRRARHHAT